MAPCTVLINKYGHWLVEFRNTTMEIMLFSKGLLHSVISNPALPVWFGVGGSRPYHSSLQVLDKDLPAEQNL